MASERPIPILLAAEATQFRVLPLLPIVVLNVGVRDRQGNRDGGKVRRAELEANVSAIKRGDVFAATGINRLPELLRLCLFEGMLEDFLSAALPGSRRMLWPISSRCCGIVQLYVTKMDDNRQ